MTQCACGNRGHTVRFPHGATPRALYPQKASGRRAVEYWPGWGWYRSGEIATENYVQGSLVIDMADRAKERLVWHGYGSENLFSQTSSDQTFKQAVDAVLAKYPPPGAASPK
jgi:hypothetical protein